MNCKVCRKELSGRKTTFCSSTCALMHKSEVDKINYRKHRPLRPKRLCLFCGNLFQPRGESHRCCNKVCREQLVLKRNRDKPNKGSQNTKFWLSPSTKKDRPHKKLNPLPTVNSEYSDQITEFLRAGGKIEVQPQQLNGRTPDVNITNLSGWSVESMYGFGYELELMDELSSASEVMDAN